jgi:queuine tRNA-ribosyltransferase
MNHELVRTRSGALAMRDLTSGEVMHPGVGPLVEAQRLYVEQSRLEKRLREDGRATLVVFDVGMGAGSNALAARAASECAPAGVARLELVSFERELGALHFALIHAADFGLEGDSGVAARALLAAGYHDSPRTCWRLVQGDVLTAFAREPHRPDIVFWDPFSPKANPLLWTIAAFSALRRVAGPACTLFTYSASTAVRIALLLGGWAVGVGDAIGDKAATTAAAVRPTDLARPLDRRWLARLARPDVPLPCDAPADVVARVTSAPQFCALW